MLKDTEGGLSALHHAEGEGYVRRPEDSRAGISAEFSYSSYYTSFTRRIYELQGKKKKKGATKKFTLVGFLLLVPPRSEPPQISSKREACLPPSLEASSARPDFVVLTFLSKQQNKMSLSKKPGQSGGEGGLLVAVRQGKTEEQNRRKKGEATADGFKSCKTNGFD